MKVQARIITTDLCAASLKACDPDDFPNLYILLKIAATLPVASCECERSISKMGESRLSSLAICVSSTIGLSIWTKLSICLKASALG